MRPTRIFLLGVLATVGLAAFGAPSASAGAKFANLTGAQEVPGPADPDGSASAFLSLKPATGQVCVAQRHGKIDAPTGMHIHSGAAGVAGPIVVDLTSTLTGSACVTSTTALVREIDRDPQDFYLNIHTTPFPNGAIRGQLDASIVGSGMPTTSGIGHLYGRMTGGQEVPGPGDANGRGGVFIDVHPGAGTACVNERYTEIATPPQLMHIHSGALGVSGPIVVDLTTALNGGPACVTADPVVLRDIRSHPTQFYCNIHNGPFPNGAIRGQLKVSE